VDQHRLSIVAPRFLAHARFNERTVSGHVTGGVPALIYETYKGYVKLQ
jgi:hypothetical protein